LDPKENNESVNVGEQEKDQLERIGKIATPNDGMNKIVRYRSFVWVKD